VHNHAPEATRFVVSQTLAKLKEQARNTNDQPCQIIQDTVTSMPEEAYPYMPSKNGLRQQIKHVRREDTPPEPHSLEELVIPDINKITLGGDNFLLKDSMVGDERILLFCTRNNERLIQANQEVMDGTE